MNPEHVLYNRKVEKQEAILLESGVFEAAQNGDADAFGKVYNTYFDSIFRFVYFRTSHTETAEDLTEETFIKAFHGLKGLKGGPSKIHGWLYTIARHAIIDHYRKSGRDNTVNVEELESLPDYAPTALDMLSLKAEQHALVEALEQLAPEQQTIIKLRFLEGFEIAEIATILNKSQGNIRIIQYRGLQKLRTLLS